MARNEFYSIYWAPYPSVLYLLMIFISLAMSFLDGPAFLITLSWWVDLLCMLFYCHFLTFIWSSAFCRLSLCCWHPYCCNDDLKFFLMSGVALTLLSEWISLIFLVFLTSVIIKSKFWLFSFFFLLIMLSNDCFNC